MDPQQLREALSDDRNCRFLLHDRHKAFSASLAEKVESWGIHVLRSPVRGPTANEQANDSSERLVASVRTTSFLSLPITCVESSASGSDITIPAVHTGPERRSKEYILYMASNFEFFEKRATEVMGHEIRHMLLLHANQLNADAMPELIALRGGYVNSANRLGHL
jgi:hypothetical protein